MKKALRQLVNEYLSPRTGTEALYPHLRPEVDLQEALCKRSLTD